MPTGQFVKYVWDALPVEAHLDQLRSRVERLLLEWRIPSLSLLGAVRREFKPVDAKTDSESRPRSGLAAASVWDHPYMKWHDQVEQGQQPPEWRVMADPPSPEAHRKNLLEVLTFAARIDHLVDCVQDRIASEPDARGLRETDRELYDALHLLSLVEVDDMIRGARQRAINRQNARKPHREAAIVLFRRIIEKEEATTLPEVLHWAGTGYYREVELAGTRYRFQKSGEKLRISWVEKSGKKRVHDQRCTKPGGWNSTVYEWFSEAKNLRG